MLEKIIEILQFWFGTDKDNLLSQSQQWWKSSPEYDATIKEKFEKLHHLAATGELDQWLNQPQSCLAYIILLDQFSRNMYRHSPLAFAQDKLALAACENGRAHKLDKELHLIHRLFFYMPLMHSEDLNDQKLCLILIRQLVEESKGSPQYLNTLEKSLEFSQKHYDIIRNFSRFPQRNAILDRESTQEELVFLSLPNNHF